MEGLIWRKDVEFKGKMNGSIYNAGGDIMEDANVEKGKMDKESAFICPVCGNQVYYKNLPSAESVVKENLYSMGGVLIVNSRVQLHCDFEHFLDETGMKLDEPHTLQGLVDAVFDQSGECIHFEIVEVCPSRMEFMEFKIRKKENSKNQRYIHC